MKNFKKVVATVMALATVGSLSTVCASAGSITQIENGKEVTYYDTYEEYIEATGDDGEGSYLCWFVHHNTNNMGEWRDVSVDIPDSSNENATIGDSNTIGESEELQPTGVRGDINYDGKVDGKDLMLLKKYILGLITW